MVAQATLDAIPTHTCRRPDRVSAAVPDPASLVSAAWLGEFGQLIMDAITSPKDAIVAAQVFNSASLTRSGAGRHPCVRGAAAVAVDTDCVPCYDVTGVGYADANPVAADTDGTPYLVIGA